MIDMSSGKAGSKLTKAAKDEFVPGTSKKRIYGNVSFLPEPGMPIKS